MPADEFGEKTEQPTLRRRREARQQGHVARSTDLVAAGMMLAAVLAVWLFGESLLRSLGELTQASLQGAASRPIGPVTTVQQLSGLGKLVAVAVLPILLLMMTAALLFNVVQVGFLTAPDVLQPRLTRLNPLEGARRILSVRTWVRLGLSLGKLATLGVVAAWSISTLLPQFLQLTELEPSRLFLEIHSTIVRLGLQLAAALFVLALLDFAFQKWKYERDLRMTKQEVRDEMKQLQGDPLIQQRRRAAHRKLASRVEG